MSYVRQCLLRLLYWTLIALGILLVSRLAFAMAYWPKGQRLGAWIEIFFYGLRFDLATLPILLLPSFLLLPASCLLLPTHALSQRVRFYVEFFQSIWIALLCMLLAASVYNFGVNNKHFGWEFVAYLEDAPKILSGLYIDSPFLFYIFMAILPAFLVLAYFLLRTPSDAKLGIRPIKRVQWPAALVSQVLILAACVVALRGGLGQSPLRIADAMRTQSSFLNNASINGVLSVTLSLRSKGEFQAYFPSEKNIRFVQGRIDNPKAFLDSRYPLVRRMPKMRIAQRRFGFLGKPNFVLIILESFTAKFLQTHGGSPRIAPGLNRLIQRGLYFRRFMASGGRSANGLYSMFAGLPDRAGTTILRMPEINQPYSGLPALLKSKGYSTLFLHGGELEFDNLRTVLPHLGFERLAGYREIKKSGRYPVSTPWGFDDRYSFDFLYHTLHAAQEPFFAAIFTVNTHHPYIHPKDPSKNIFPDSTPENRYLNSYHYTDRILSEFLDRASGTSWFKNTIFLITADHAHHRGLNYLEDRQIPLLLYAPGHIPAAINTKLYSQVDILPTLLALSGGNQRYASMGRNMLSESHPTPNFAFYAGGSGTNLIGLIEGDYLLVHSLDVKQQFLLKGRPPALEADLSAQHPGITRRMLNETLQIQQFVRFLEKENRVWPNKRL